MIDCDYTKTPFIVGLFCGTGKPSNVHDYLKAFVDDLTQLLRNGMTFRGKPLKMMVCSFIQYVMLQHVLLLNRLSPTMATLGVISAIKLVCG